MCSCSSWRSSPVRRRGEWPSAPPIAEAVADKCARGCAAVVLCRKRRIVLALHGDPADEPDEGDCRGSGVDAGGGAAVGPALPGPGLEIDTEQGVAAGGA